MSRDFLKRIQVLFEQICAIPEGRACAAVKEEYENLLVDIRSALANKQTSASELQCLYPYIHVIKVLSEAAVQSDAIFKQSQHKLIAQVNECLKKDAGTTGPMPPGSAPSDVEINVDYDPWRQWYSEHITHPYYDNRERDWLLRQIPGMTPQKMQTWFVNVRRRSGWSELYKNYADNKRENMEAIFDACDDSDSSVNEKVAPEARKLVAKIRQYLTLESKKTQIAPWLTSLLDTYKQKTSSKTVESSDAEDQKPIISSSASKNRSRPSKKRKATDENSNTITPHKRSKPSLYKNPHHPPTPASSVSPSTPYKRIPAPATSSMSPRSSPDLRTPPSFQTKAGSPEHIIPPFSAWTPPTQSTPTPPSYIQPQQPLSSFDPAQAQAFAQTYALPPIQVQAPGQHFISNNNHIVYNVSPTAYPYPQGIPMPPVAYTMHPQSSWNQPQWPQTFQHAEPTFYTPSPPVAYPSSTHNMLSNLSSTHPVKRKYEAEEDELPSTPTAQYKRGRTSAYNTDAPKAFGGEYFVESGLNFNSHEYDCSGIHVEPHAHSSHHLSSGLYNFSP